MPVVRRDHCARGLRVGVATSREGSTDDQQERDQTAGDVQAVEAGGEVEDRAIGVGGDADAFLEQAGVLAYLTGDEDRAEDLGQDIPLAHAPLSDLQQ